MQILRYLILPLAALSFANPTLIAQVPDHPSYLDQKKPIPKSTRFTHLLPAKVADFARISFKEPQPGLDGEALYKSGEQEIFMLFSLAENREDVDEIRRTIRAEVQKEKLSQPQQSRVSTDLGYIRLIGKTIAFYAWNRGQYCFSADSKGAISPLWTVLCKHSSIDLSDSAYPAPMFVMNRKVKLLSSWYIGNR
ncbi:hypothetical protein [Larkinella rosea]|uniref:Uncharacterized protein n=1 Tax=Larkinella rosea TaxID=2025312 RepID=A0A3P1BYY2_9BACT|nr:hypothetical protein [Larkinella rosea]RRB06305.1 hypothetical protein EHT25_00420 [Larkinella rosea]